ncbi:MAG: adenine phosphoribosyltransferase [Candidatus Nanopelagicales bacterium]|jgi:adenine phosphoribosyltransferase|nr:adenine phosphoribosyltransferase [Candidatus Nanopelagicales bacterium]
MFIPPHLEYAISKIADVPDFPKPGILFKDITPLLQDKKAFNDAVDDLASHLNGANKVAGIESRGFIFAAAIAAKHNLGLVLLRKPGKLPRKTHVVQYELEYGFDSLEMHQDALDKNDRVLLVDDVLATGGTMMAGCELIAKSGAKLTNCAVFIEISALNGRNRLSSIPIHSSIIV